MTKTNDSTILVIEDDPLAAEVLKNRLRSWGYDIHAMACGKTGLSWAFHNKMDLVVLDVRLPDLDGYRVCAELRKRFGPELPILMLTGMDQPKDEMKGFFQGADAYLTKPYDPEELRKTVSFLLGLPQLALTGFRG